MLINFYNEVPHVYLDASRDFQYISRLANIVLNSVKHNVDDLYDLPNVKENTRLAELLAMTLGFRIRRKYNQEQLVTLVSILPDILKNKGTEKAVILIGNALIHAAGSSGQVNCTFSEGTIEITLPKESIDFTLLIDVLPYILPAGITYRISRRTQLSKAKQTNLTSTDTKIAHFEHERELSALYVVPDKLSLNTPVFSNYSNDQTTGNETLNSGLEINTIIPVLEDFMYDGTEGISELDSEKEEDKT